MIPRCTAPLIYYMYNIIAGYLNQVKWKINKPDTFCVNISVLYFMYGTVRPLFSQHKQMQSRDNILAYRYTEIHSVSAVV
jgi:hypothetical protein